MFDSDAASDFVGEGFLEFAEAHIVQIPPTEKKPFKRLSRGALPFLTVGRKGIVGCIRKPEISVFSRQREIPPTALCSGLRLPFS